MSITVIISDQVQLAGAGAAAVAYGAESTQAFLQNLLEQNCLSYREQFAVDRIPSSAFIFRFTDVEYASILAAGNTDPAIEGFVDSLNSAPYVWLGAQEVIDAMNYIVSKGLLTAAREAAILYYPIPSP